MLNYLLHTSIASVQNGNPQLQCLNHHGAHLTCQGEDLTKLPRKEVVRHTYWAFSSLANVTLGQGVLALWQVPRVYLETVTFAGTYHLKNHLRSATLVQPCLLIQCFLLLHLLLLGKEVIWKGLLSAPSVYTAVLSAHVPLEEVQRGKVS